jgi:hypothetical protein
MEGAAQRFLSRLVMREVDMDSVTRSHLWGRYLPRLRDPHWGARRIRRRTLKAYCGNFGGEAVVDAPGQADYITKCSQITLSKLINPTHCHLFYIFSREISDIYTCICKILMRIMYYK